MNYSRDDILQMVEEEDVEFIRLQFTDIFGTLKNVAITRNNLDKALDNRFLFDGTYVDGFDSANETEMYLCPDPDTFTIFPWRPQAGKVARLICDVCTTDGKPLAYAPREILKRVLAEAEAEGLTVNVGPECEFFLFELDDMGRPTTETVEQAGYLDLGHSDVGENVRRDMVFTLEDMGFDIESSYHEKGRGQHEIDFKYTRGLQAADDILTFQLAVRNVAKKHGMLATFMPKPLGDVVGSGMHLNFSLEKDGKNIFYDAQDEKHLSQTAYSFMAGVLEHLNGMALITNPLINSYKRLAGTRFVPNQIAFTDQGKNCAIRIPFFKRAENARIELKSPDATSNPYLTLAVVLAAGLDGIRRGASCDAFRYQEAKSFEKLPQAMGEAISSFAEDTFIRKVLGADIADRYIAGKQMEWQEYIQNVTEWETKRYLGRY